MTNIGEQGARDFARLGIMARSVENDVTTIDAFLPPDLAVDLVKIDIEGHEPLAMRGMARTIAHSPRLRFIIEFDERFLAHRSDQITAQHLARRGPSTYGKSPRCRETCLIKPYLGVAGRFVQNRNGAGGTPI
jgi:hypothetical protein